jgi:type II secretion system protein N
MNWRALAKVAAYSLWFLVCTAFFAYLTFPTEKVRSFAEQQLSRRMGAKVSIGDLELDGLSEVHLYDVVIEKDRKADKAAPGPAPEGLPSEPTAEGAPEGANGAAAPEAPAQQPANDDAKASTKTVTKLNYLRVELDLFDFVGDGAKDLEIDIEAFGGTINGVLVTLDGGEVDIDAPEIEDVDLALVGLLQGALPFPLTGTLDGSLQVTWRKELAQSNVTADIRLSDAILESPKVESKAYGPIQLTDIALGTLSTKVRVGSKDSFPQLRAIPGAKDAPVLWFEQLEASGDDIEIVGDERNVAMLMSGLPVGQAMLTAQLAFHLREVFFDKKETRDGVEETPNRFLRTVIQSDKRFKSAEKNGFYGLSCKGNLAKPDCSLVRTTLRVGIQKGAPTLPVGEGDGTETPNAGAENPEAGGRDRGTARGEGREPSTPAERVRAAAAEREAANPERAIQPSTPAFPPTPEGGVGGDADAARSRLEELRKQREERMAQLREERQRLGAAREGDPAIEPLSPSLEVGGEAMGGESPLEPGGVEPELPPEEPPLEEAVPLQDEPEGPAEGAQELPAEGLPEELPQ